MPNQIHSNKSLPKTYDAGDLSDAFCISESDLNWSFTAINTISKKITQLQERLKDAYGVDECYFAELEALTGMFEYLIDERHEYHFKESEKYSKELKQLRGQDQ